jgi:hypothetical protein
VTKVAITFSSATVNGAGSGGGVMPAFFSASFSIDRHLGRAQIGAGRFVDQLSDDRLAVGDLSVLSVDGRDHLLVERVDRQRRHAFRARSARVAGLAFLETAVQRRLAAADLVIALSSRTSSSRHPFHPARRGRHLPPACHSEFPPHLRQPYEKVNE